MAVTFQRITGLLGCLVVFGATLMIRGVYPEEFKEEYVAYVVGCGGFLLPMGTLMILSDQRARAQRPRTVARGRSSVGNRDWPCLALFSQANAPAVPLVNTVIWMLAAMIIAFIQPALLLSVLILAGAYLSAVLFERYCQL